MAWKIIDRILLPTAFFLIAFVAALTLWQLLINHRRTEIQAVTNEQVTFVKSKIESELTARLLPLERLAGRWSDRSRPESEEASDALLVMSGYPAYQAVEFADPTYHIRWATPQDRNKSDIGADLSTNPDELQALKSAADTRSAVATRSVSLRQGGRGILICVPVYSQSQLSGFLIGVFRYQEVIASILQDMAQGYSVAIYDGNENIYGPKVGLAPQDQAWVQSTDIRFQQLLWRVQVWPNPQTRSYVLSLLPQVAFVIGIILAGLLAFTVYMAETARLHAKEVVASNKELKKEIAVREQAEQALIEAQKMEAVGRLAGGVAHDFNNLLMVIRGHAALSLNRAGSDGALRRELSEILKYTERASILTRRLLAFSRKQVLQLRVIDLNALVTQVRDLLPPVLGEDIRLTMDLDPKLGNVKADSAQMEQAIMNLVFNARDAMPQGGELTIQTANTELDEAWVRSHPGVQPGPHVMLAVHDNGHGMDESVLAHFRAFLHDQRPYQGNGPRACDSLRKRSPKRWVRHGFEQTRERNDFSDISSEGRRTGRGG